jgi:tetratricopeptide (TPR) repeat protein
MKGGQECPPHTVCHNVGMKPRHLPFTFLPVIVWLVAGMLMAQAPNPAASEAASDTAALIKQAQKLNSEGKQNEALAIYEKVLEQSPNDLEAHLGMGAALDLKGDYAGARKHLNRAVEIAPAEAKERARRTLAMSYAFECNLGEAGKLETQVFDARKARHDSIGAAEVANEAGRLYLECGDLDQAEQWYKTGYQTSTAKTDMSEPDRNLWLFRWTHAQARIAARRGDRETAGKYVEAAKKALDHANNPDQARFYPYLTGYVAFYAGDYKAAIADLQQADQRDPFVLCLIAQAYEKSGDQAQAMEYYRKVLASNAHNPTNAFARPLAKKKLGRSS